MPAMKASLGAILEGRTSDVSDDDGHRIFVYSLVVGMFRVCGQQSGLFALAVRDYVSPAIAEQGGVGSVDQELAELSDEEVRRSADRLGIFAGVRLAQQYGCWSRELLSVQDSIGVVVGDALMKK